ncbi:MAG: histidinol-phosphatase [Erysipelotrichaceae bacterium]|jgi:histidinol-phosphatase (PHP family)|nr:histidinol-phosphatase [Erysipelotrichaceae bacterium]
MLANYHTHTYRCKHAIGKDEDYVLAAIANGYKRMAFTDHSPWPLLPDENASIRMDLEQMPEYFRSLRNLRRHYKDQIAIDIGLECEYYPDRIDWLKEQMMRYQMDLVIFGNHFYKRGRYDLYFGHYYNRETLLYDYLESSVAGMRTGIYSIMAHPDIFMRSYGKWDDAVEGMVHELCKVAKQTNTILEYNLGGIRAKSGYPHPEFWRVVAEEGNTAMIGIDAHSPMHYYDYKNVQAAERYLLGRGIRLTESW